jgi:hypothetical protein
VVIVFTEILVGVLLWVEEQLASEELEGHAGKGPHISGEIVLGA